MAGLTLQGFQRHNTSCPAEEFYSQKAENVFHRNLQSRKALFSMFQICKMRHHLLLTFHKPHTISVKSCNKGTEFSGLLMDSAGSLVSETRGQGVAFEFLLLYISRVSHLNPSYPMPLYNQPRETKYLPSRDSSADCTAKVKATVDIKKPPCYPVSELKCQKSQKSPAQTNRHICQQLLLIFWNYSIDYFIAKKKKRYLWWWLKSLEIPSQILSGVNWSCSSKSRGHCQFTQVELAR